METKNYNGWYKKFSGRVVLAHYYQDGISDCDEEIKPKTEYLKVEISKILESKVCKKCMRGGKL
jgi:hypothetical protein